VINLIFNWTGIAGQTYQLEYKDDLTSRTWTPLGSPVTRNGGMWTTTNNFGASSRRLSGCGWSIRSASKIGKRRWKFGRRSYQRQRKVSRAGPN
jgi:hypothetical protein